MPVYLFVLEENLTPNSTIVFKHVIIRNAHKEDFR